MRLIINRVAEDKKTGFVLYQRTNTVLGGESVSSHMRGRKYFINNPVTQDYFEEFATIRKARAIFKKLTGIAIALLIFTSCGTQRKINHWDSGGFSGYHGSRNNVKCKHILQMQEAESLVNY